MFNRLFEYLFSTPASRTELCPCPCHLSGIYGGTQCTSDCANYGLKLDGCHTCGCSGTMCVLGECNTGYVDCTKYGPCPLFGLGSIIVWKKRPKLRAKIKEIHFGAYRVELLDPISGHGTGYCFNAEFGFIQELAELDGQ